MPAAPQQGNQGDNSAGILWGIAAIFIACGTIWFVFKDYIVIGYLSLKLYEVHFLSLFSDTHFLPLQHVLESAISQPEKLSFAQLGTLGGSVGEYFRIPFLILLFLLAVIVYLGNTTRVFRRIYNMKELAKLELVNWPQISPVVNLDLVKTNIDKGPWAMAMTPMQFCKRYRLLEEVRGQRREGMARKEWDKIEAILKRGEANKVFAMQLGPLWNGPDKLPPHTKALFAAFAARINADTKPAEKLFRQLNVSSSSKLDLTGVDDLIKKHYNTKAVQEIVRSHAYVLTIMASMLETSREDGVQASADFLWVKPLDRRLWYTLNTVGRQTPFVEVAGIYAHWLAEKTAGHYLMVPIIEEATKALDIALKEVVYRPDEQ